MSARHGCRNTGSREADTRRPNRRSDPLEASRGTVVSVSAGSDPSARRAIDASRSDPMSVSAPTTAVAIAISSFCRLIVSLETHAFDPPTALTTMPTTGACLRTVTGADTSNYICVSPRTGLLVAP